MKKVFVTETSNILNNLRHSSHVLWQLSSLSSLFNMVKGKETKKWWFTYVKYITRHNEHKYKNTTEFNSNRNQTKLKMEHCIWIKAHSELLQIVRKPYEVDQAESSVWLASRWVFSCDSWNQQHHHNILHIELIVKQKTRNCVYSECFRTNLGSSRFEN